MLIFHLKKEWFEKVKSGEKTHEYRVYNDYWLKRIVRCLYLDCPVYIPPGPICFALGYPKKEDKDKIIKAFITKVSVRNGSFTDLKYDGMVFDIQFKVAKE